MVTVHSKEELIELVQKETESHINDVVLDLNFIDISEVTDLRGVFTYSKFKGQLDISRWDVSRAKDMSSMFEDSKFNHDIGDWNTSSVVNLSRMFKHCPFTTEDLSKWKLDSLIKFEDFGYSRHIKTTGWSEQLKNRKIINLEKIGDLEQLKGVVLFGFLDKTE